VAARAGRGGKRLSKYLKLTVGGGTVVEDVGVSRLWVDRVGE